MAIKEFQLLTSELNELLHTIRLTTGEWYRFGDVLLATKKSLPVPISGISSAGIDDQLHVCVNGGSYQLFHTVRFGDGNWTVFGDVGAVTGLSEQVQTQCCASVAGELHVIAGTAVKVRHAIRHPNGIWTEFGDVFYETGSPANPVFSVAAAGVGAELHVCFVDAQQRLLHTIRHSNGTWTPLEDLSSTLGLPAKPSYLACAAVSGELHVAFIDWGFIGAKNGLWHAIRHTDSTWTPFGDVKAVAGDHGSVLVVRCAEVQGELQLITVSSDLPDLWHTIRYQDGTWQKFGNAELAITGHVGQKIFSLVACAGVDQGTYRPPNGDAGPGPDCFPGVPGIERLQLSNGSDDQLTIWSSDLVTGVPSLVGDLAPSNSIDVHLTDCHYSKVIAVDHSWVADYNTTFGTNYDPHDWQTANTVNFQRWYATILGRANSQVQSASIN
jgi:hypothetical protein